MGFRRPLGARVAQVTVGGPSASAGLRQGDVVLALDGVELEDASRLRWLSSLRKAGEAVHLRVQRGDAITDVVVILSEPPAPQTSIVATDRPPTLGGRVQRVEGAQGPQIQVADLDDEARARIGIGDAPALIVIRVEERTAPWLAGVREGDIITHLNDIAVSNADDFTRALQTLPRGKEVQLRLRRGRSQVFVSFMVR